MNLKPRATWAGLAAAVLLLVGCQGGPEDASTSPQPDRSPAGAATPTSAPNPTTASAAATLSVTASSGTSGPTTPSRSPARCANGNGIQHVILVSVDALTPVALEQLPAAKLPNFRRLITAGMSTMNARTTVEMTITLPNHVGMVTGRGIAVDNKGHGVQHNGDPADDRLQLTSGDPTIQTAFDVVHDAGGSTALFTAKDKLNILRDTDPAALDTFVVNHDDASLARAAAVKIAQDQPTFTMVHLAGPDVAGHAHKGLSPAYLKAVEQADRDLGVVLDAIDTEAWCSTRLILTADHGVNPGSRDHGVLVPANWTIPFIVYGAGVQTGDLYQANPRFVDPGTAMPGWTSTQPIRNLDAANLITRSLKLGPVPGSFDRPKVGVKIKP